MKKLCKNCGFTGKMKKKSKGSIWIELVLWVIGILFLVLLRVAFGYSLYRFLIKYEVCPKCKNTNIISLNSPVAREMLKGGVEWIA